MCSKGPTGLDQKMAASIFYAVWNTSGRRMMADAAMCARLDGRPELTEWIALRKRIDPGPRNLLGHNVVEKDITHTLSPTGFRSPYKSDVLDLGRTGGSPYEMELGRVILEEPRFFVSQDETQIMAGNRRPWKADFDSLFAYCNDVIGILNDLNAFLQRIP
jgi:hypothetical protein